VPDVVQQNGSAIKNRIFAAARALAAVKPVDQIDLSEVARAASVSWPTVKRHVGSKRELRERLLREQPELACRLRDTRTRLLEAAVRVFARRGYERSTLDEVAAEAGLTKGAVYWHFQSKSELCASLVALLTEQAEHSDSTSRDPDLGAPNAGLCAVDAYSLCAEFILKEVKRALAAPDWSKLAAEFAARAEDPDVQRLIRDSFRARRLELERLARHLQDAGELADDVEASHLGIVLNALAQGLVLSWLVDPEAVDLPAVARTAGELVSFGLSAAPAVKSRPRARSR
jgi:TetR/AcrR family acrAB operon transcriptional repressor